MIIRLFVTDRLCQGARVALAERHVHYLRTVMRRSISDHVHIFNGQDGEWEATITDLSKKYGALTVDKQTCDQKTEPDIWLIFAKIKKQAVDTIIQKGTEMGVSQFHPVFTERSGAKSENSERLNIIATEAAEQCERLTMPTIQPSQPLEQLLLQWDHTRTLIYCDETGGGTPMGKVVGTLKDTPAAILIGPEGGFSPKELEALSAAPFAVPVGLGPRILRANTAAIAALACWQSACGDWAEAPNFLST